MQSKNYDCGEHTLCIHTLNTTIEFYNTCVLLGSADAEGEKVKKKVKKAEPKDLSMFDTDAPNIFDDPLSALSSTS